jgi:hypothetical protein
MAPLTPLHAVQVAPVHICSAGKVSERQASIDASARERVGEICLLVLPLPCRQLAPMGGGDSETSQVFPSGAP